jgi:hypothetical protein
LVAGSGSDSKSAGAEGARSSALRTPRLLAVIAFGYAIGSLGATRDLVNPFRDWARHHSNVPVARLGIASTASLVLVPLLAWMSDRLALRGVRRRTWLLFLSLALAAFWFLFDPESSVGVSTVAGLGTLLLLGNVLHAILGGLAVDTGQRYTATSAVSGARELGIRAAMLAAAIVGSSDTQPPVVSTTRALAMGCGLLAIACGLVREWPSAHKESPGEGTFRSRGFWAGVLFLVWLGGLDQVARALVKLRVSSLVADSFVAAPGWLGPLVSLLLAIVYIRFGRRLPARRLPLFALAVGGGTIALAVASFVLPPDRRPGARLPRLASRRRLRNALRFSASLGFRLLVPAHAPTPGDLGRRRAAPPYALGAGTLGGSRTHDRVCRVADRRCRRLAFVARDDRQARRQRPTQRFSVRPSAEDSRRRRCAALVRLAHALVRCGFILAAVRPDD